MIRIRILESISSIEARINDIESKLDSLSPKKEFKETLDKVLDNSKEGIDGIIKEVSKKYKMDEELVGLVADAESDKNPYALSPKGAMGVMQLMPDTAKGLGVKNPFDPRENIEGGVKFLKEMMERYDGNVKKALAAYNSGPGTVDKYNGVPPYKETQNYVQKIMKEYTETKGGK